MNNKGFMETEEIVKHLKAEYDNKLGRKLYARLTGFIKYLSSGYTNLTRFDKESFAMEELWKTVVDYDFEGKASFITLFRVYFTNRLKQESKSRHYHRRRANYKKELGSVNNLFYGERDLEEDVEIFDTIVDNLEDFKKMILTITIEQTDLSTVEKKYCKSIIQHEYRDVEAAELLELTPQAIHYMRRRIRIKLFEKISDFI